PTPLVSDYFLDFEQPFEFIAESNIDADSVIVQIRAGVSSQTTAAAAFHQEIRSKAWQKAVAQREAETPAAVGAAPKPAPSESMTTKNFSKATMQRGKGGRGQRLTSDMPESEFVYSDFAKANILIKQFLDHFEVTATPDTLARTAQRDTSTITIQAKDKNDQDITIPDDALLDFALDANGESLGNLLAPNGSQAKSLTNISYGDARTGKVKYLTNGELPDSTQQISITVSKSDDATIKGTGTVVVQCHILPPRYAQNGGDWGDDVYDTSNDDIATLGCALSSEAFVMTVFGDTINPGELNTWMKEKKGREGGFYGRKVNWYAMEKHSPGTMDIMY
ncbi:MAG: hypothetical protein ACRENG_39045, partial [bacterium]